MRRRPPASTRASRRTTSTASSRPFERQSCGRPARHHTPVLTRCEGDDRSQGPPVSSDMTQVADILWRPPDVAADEAQARKRLERSRFWATAFIILLAVVSLLWLTALAEPGN